MMLIVTKRLRSIGLIGICAILGGNVGANDSYFPFGTDSWEEAPTLNTSVSTSLSSSSSEEYDSYPADPDIIHYCRDFLFGKDYQTDEQPYDHSQEQAEGDEPSDLQKNLVFDLNSYNEDAQEYILCHTDLKNIGAKGHGICNALIRMKQLGVAGNSDLISQLTRNILNIEFQSHVNIIPIILSINSTESNMRNEPTCVSLPEGNSIIIPTYQPIVDRIQGLHIATRADACISQNVIDKLIPETAAIIDDLTGLESQILSLIHASSQKYVEAMKKIKNLEQKTSEPQYHILKDQSDSETTTSQDSISIASSEESNSESSGEESYDSDESTWSEGEESYYSYDEILRALLSKGDDLNAFLYDMRKEAYCALSDKLDNDVKELININLQSHIKSISNNFGYGTRKFNLGYYHEAQFTLPGSETLTAPGFGPIVDKVQGLCVLEQQDALRTICILDELIPQTAGIILDIIIIYLNIN